MFTHRFGEMGYTRFLTRERINPFIESMSQSLKMAMLMFKLRSACTYFFKICLCFPRGKSRITFVIKLLLAKENSLNLLIRILLSAVIHPSKVMMLLLHVESKTNRDVLCQCLLLTQTNKQTNGQVSRPKQTGQEARMGLLVLMIMQNRRRKGRRNKDRRTKFGQAGRQASM